MSFITYANGRIYNDTLVPSDYDKVTFPLTMLGWDLGQEINPIMYSAQEWQKYKITSFYKDVEKERISSVVISVLTLF